MKEHRSHMATLLAIAALCTASATPASARAWNLLPAGSHGWREAERPGIRGVTVGPVESSLQPGRGYGTRHSAALLDHLARRGVTWISITPFGRILDLESTTIRMDFEAPYPENREAVKRMIRQAHARGINVLLIPHLWVETGGWRGEIDPGAKERWEAYQESYRDFVLAWANAGAEAGADAFSIGVECKSWSGRFGPYWDALIDDVRAAFPGLLTYSANWDEAEDVLFWDRLDLIGINAFYPLADHDGASDEEYRQGAEAHVQGVRGLAERLSMPVLFVEVGYTTRPDAAVEPWLWPDGMSDVVVDEREQARALSAMLDAFLDEPFFVGFFVWRYYANLDDVSQEAVWGFSPHGKEAAQVLERAYRRPWAVDPSPFPSRRRHTPAVAPEGGAYPFGGLFDVPGAAQLTPLY